MTSNISKIIFMQDGAPAHTAKVTQQSAQISSQRSGRELSARELSGF